MVFATPDRLQEHAWDHLWMYLLLGRSLRVTAFGIDPSCITERPIHSSAGALSVPLQPWRSCEKCELVNYLGRYGPAKITYCIANKSFTSIIFDLRMPSGIFCVSSSSFCRCSCCAEISFARSMNSAFKVSTCLCVSTCIVRTRIGF